MSGPVNSSLFPIVLSIPIDLFPSKLSVGIVLWEIFSRGSIPYAGFSNSEVCEQMRKGYRLSPPQAAPDFLDEVFKTCWQTEPEDRASFDALILKLDVSASEWKDFKPQILTRRFTNAPPSELTTEPSKSESYNVRANRLYSHELKAKNNLPVQNLSPAQGYSDFETKEVEANYTNNDQKVSQLEALLKEKDQTITKLKQELFEIQNLQKFNK